MSQSDTKQAAGTKGWEQGEGREETKVDVCPVGACALAKVVLVRDD